MKGMVVVYDRDACVQMYYLLGDKLGFDAVEVVMNVDQAPVKAEEGVVSRNRRNFRHASSTPATRASRSITLPSL
ncbi:TPA: hypothetical protein P7Z59_004842 [Escherichia coli]|nr:hypothetical protein [Escherichia coli]HDQ2793376.1 hypothetical protein [Escherichia coli]